MGGFDTAALVQDVWQAATATFGTPAFWIRYFSPCPYTAVNSSSQNANDECTAVWSSGGHYLGPISSPYQPRLSGTTAEGNADAQTFANAMQSVYYDVIPLLLPANNTLYSWLDQEASTSLSVAYWDGWASYINGYNFAGLGTYPLYACLYCNPCALPPNCSTLESATAHCYGIWSSEPQRCANTLQNPPTWAAETCAGCGVDIGVPTVVWQFADGPPNGCFAVDVDLDVGASGFFVPDYAFKVSSNPATS